MRTLIIAGALINTAGNGNCAIESLSDVANGISISILQLLIYQLSY